MITRESVLKVKTCKVEPVECPEIESGVVYVRGVTAAQKGRYEKALYTLGRDGKPKIVDRELERVRLRLCVMTICDENGTLLFNETDEDMAAIGEMPASVIDRIFDVAQRLSGMTDEDVDELTRGMSDPLEGSPSA